VQNAISAGVNVAFFSANAMYWQIRFEPNAAGIPDRVEVGYKDFATDTTPPGPDPQWGVNNAIVTTNWRDPTVNQPENAVIGVMYEQQTDSSYAYVVQNAGSWIYANTGFVEGSSVPGIVGYEYDKVWNNGFSPPGLTVVANSPVHGCCGGFSSYANSTTYTAPSGARVFAAGTIQWSWGLSNVLGGNSYADPRIQQTTANILNNFITGPSPTTATPTFSPVGGTYSTPQSATISDTTAGAVIYYTTDGTTPTTSSPQYSGPISVVASTTIKAIAVSNSVSSYVGTATYTLQAATPTFNPLGGSYSSPQSVTISDASPGVTIYYTTNGTTPTTSSTVYTGPITVSQTETVKAIAAAAGWTTSSVASAHYKIR